MFKESWVWLVIAAMVCIQFLFTSKGTAKNKLQSIGFFSLFPLLALSVVCIFKGDKWWYGFASMVIGYVVSGFLGALFYNKPIGVFIISISAIAAPVLVILSCVLF